MSAIGRYSGKPTGGNPGFPANIKNGQIPTALLGHIETQPDTQQFPASEHYLAKDAAVGLDNMVRAAEADGVHIRLLEAYRTLDRQLYFWDQYLHGGNLAAHPGTSNHGWGTAIDVDRSDPHALPWMRLHGVRFGWDLPDELGKREPWHWQAVRGHPAGATLPPVKETPVYVHGELLAGAFYGRGGNGGVLVYLRPVAEELGWDVEAQGGTATLTRGTKTRQMPILLTQVRAVVGARKLGDLLGATVDWDGQAVRIS